MLVSIIWRGLMDAATKEALSEFPERIINKIVFTESCWLWSGAKIKGYGRVKWEGRSAQMHRLAYETLVAAIPPGLTIDHLCRTRNCVNPGHMEVVTQTVNTLRRETKKNTKCKWGHLYTEENTHINTQGKQVCRTCQRNHRYRRAGKLELIT